MIAYVLDNMDLSIKDILEFEDYDFSEDIEYSEKSSITVTKMPNVKDDDFIYCKKDNDVVFVGICENCKSSGNESEYTISMFQKECFFDRDIFVESEDLIHSTGIEDFIVTAIENNFTASGDLLMDKNYIIVQALTHTPVATKVDADDGVYNLKTYLGNVKQYYGIHTEFSFNNGQLTINVLAQNDEEIPVSAMVSDIVDCKETYEVSVLARLWVRWKIPDTEDSNGNTIVGAVTDRRFYLLANRTISEDISDVNRADGISKSMYIEAETEDEMLQEVRNEFSANRYNHKISFSLNRNSRLYPEVRFYVGRKIQIKTKSGIRSTMVTKKEISSDSVFMALSFGNLKITLIDKLRR